MKSYLKMALDLMTKTLPLCTFNAKGYCKLASRCKFKHENCSSGENCREKNCELGHPTPLCNFYKWGKCERGDVCKFKHTDCTDGEQCMTPNCNLGHPIRNKRASVDTMQQFEKKAKSSTASATPDSSQSSKLTIGDILPAVPIPTLTNNKRAWRKHTSQESKARKKRRAKKLKEIARIVLSSSVSKLKVSNKILSKCLVDLCSGG